MGFIVRDRNGPSFAEINSYRKIRNMILRKWNTKTVTDINGVERTVFENDSNYMRFYAGDRLQDSMFWRNWYSSLGTSYEEMKDGNFSDIAYAWFALEPGLFFGSRPTKSYIAQKINEAIPIGSKITIRFVYGNQSPNSIESLTLHEDISAQAVHDKIFADESSLLYYTMYLKLSVDDIRDIASCKKYGGTKDINLCSKTSSYRLGHIPLDLYSNNSNPLSFLAMFDLNQTVFSRGEIHGERILYSEIGSPSRHNNRYSSGCEFKITYTKISDASSADSFVQTIDDAFTMLYIKNDISKNIMHNKGKGMNLSSLNQQKTLSKSSAAYDALEYLISKSGGSNIIVEVNEIFSTKLYIDVDEFKTMKAKDAALLVSQSLKVRYQEKAASAWETITFIGILILAVAAAYISAGSATPGSLAAIAAAAGSASLVLVLGSIVLSRMGASAGMYTRVIGGMSQATGKVALITGILSMTNNLIKKTFKEFAEKAGEEAVIQQGLEVGTEAAIELSNNVIEQYSVIDFGKDLIIDSVSSFSNAGSSVLNIYNLYANINKALNMPKPQSAPTNNDTNDLTEPTETLEVVQGEMYGIDMIERTEQLIDESLGMRQTEALMQKHML